MKTTKAIEAHGLSKAYGPVVALRNVSFSVDKGEIIGLLGPNGAGKTTLMKILTGFLQADAGRGEICGVDVAEDPLGVQAKIGYLPENAPLYREMVVEEYLLMISELRGVPHARRRAWIGEAVEATGLEQHLGRHIGKLSKGYRQRVGLAQALLHKPEILILDEPTSGLDPTQIVEIRELISTLSQRSTVMLSTHILSEVEKTCQRVIMIARGELRADDSLESLQAVNAAVVAIHKDADGVEPFLAAIAGVDEVEARDAVGDYRYWRVTSESNQELCPALFEALRGKDWRIGELRSDSRTLESVFRDIATSSAQEAAA